MLNLLAGWITGIGDLNVSIYLGYFVIYEQFKCYAQLSRAWKKFYNLGTSSD